MTIPNVIVDDYGFVGPPGPRGKDGRNGFDGRPGARGEDGLDGEGFKPVGDWNISRRYHPNEVVTYNGSSFVCAIPHAGRIPGTGAKRFWQLLAAKGDRGPAGSQGFRGRQGIQGESGESGSVATVNGVFDSPTVTGQPIYVTQAGGIELADASSPSTSRCVGLASGDVVSGGAGSYQTGGPITLPDWTAVTGTASLAPGDLYFLGTTTGTLTNTPPETEGEVWAPIGDAVNANTLNIEIQTRVLL